MWMYREIYAERLMTLMVVVIYSPNGEVTDVDQRTGDWHEDAKTFVNVSLAACFRALKYFVTMGLYIDITCLVMAQSPACSRPACGQARHFMSFWSRCGTLPRTGKQFTGSMHLNFENSTLQLLSNFCDQILMAEIAEMQGSQNAPVRIAKKAEHGVPDVRRRSACHAVITSGSSHCLEGIR